MNPKTLFLTLAFMLCSLVSSFAGGGECQFQTSALPLLERSPLLKEILTTKFLLEEKGAMGPLDAPFDGGRQYTYMEFQASSAEDKAQKFMIRIHFKFGRTLEKVEFVPLVISSKPE